MLNLISTGLIMAKSYLAHSTGESAFFRAFSTRELMAAHQQTTAGAGGPRTNNNRVPWNPWPQGPPPLWKVEEIFNNRIEEVKHLIQQEQDAKQQIQLQLELKEEKVNELQQKIKEEKAATEQLQEVFVAQNQKLKQMASTSNIASNLRMFISSLQQQLEEEKMRADNLEDALREAQRREELEREKLDTPKVEMSVKSSSELASKLQHEEVVSQALLQVLQELSTDRQECVQENEPSHQTADTLEDSVQEPPRPDQDTSTDMQVSPELVEEPSVVDRVSLWRRFKKAITPKHCRQYKRQRQHQE